MTPQLLATGKDLYGKQCAICHGVSGAGDGSAAYLLNPRPRDFTRNEFRLISTINMRATPEDLFITITRGMPGSAMPSWESLTPAERWSLVYYVLELTGRTVEEIPAEAWIHVPTETEKSPNSLVRGRNLFAEGCAPCHGPLGKGDGPQVMRDNLGFLVRPRDLTAGIFKGSSGSEDLYKRIVAGLPGSPMPGYAGVYTAEQIWDLVHFVQSLLKPGVEERVRLLSQSLTAKKVRQGSDRLQDPSDKIWEKVPAITISLTPLWWRDKRPEGIDVRALHNGKELAIHLRWRDPSRDASLLTPQDFSDGVAVQFSLAENPPFFGMGDSSGMAQIWHWKAAWQEDAAERRDLEHAYPNAAVDWYPGQRTYRFGDPFEVREAKTISQDSLLLSGWGAGNPLSNPNRHPAEEAVARGLGTITSLPTVLQKVCAKGAWADGQWEVVLMRPLDSRENGAFSVKPGDMVSCAFAVWDGSSGDRNGQKSVSIWNKLLLEK